MDRHFTVSGFVVHEGRTALHWHRKLEMWLPAGGHVEANEDPVQAVLREVREEFSVEAEVMQLAPRTHGSAGPTQLEPPYSIQNCIIEPGHEHVDFVYFLNLVSGYPGVPEDPENPIVWFSAANLQTGTGVHNGVAMPLAPDVQSLGLDAIRLATAQPLKT